MSEKKYEKKLKFQNKLISRQSEQIQSLTAEIAKLKLEIEEKNKMINSIASLKDELAKNISDTKKYKKEYKELIDELRKMKEVMNQTVYKGKWWLIKFLIK